MCSSGVCTKCERNTDCTDLASPICELSLGLCRARIAVTKPDIMCVQNTQSPEVLHASTYQKALWSAQEYCLHLT